MLGGALTMNIPVVFPVSSQAVARTIIPGLVVVLAVAPVPSICAHTRLVLLP